MLYIKEHENGLRELLAEVGYKILLDDNSLVDSIFIPKNKTEKDYVSVKDSDYIPPLEIPEDTTDPLQTLKENQIKLSKSSLSAYLEQNPMFSTVKYEEGRYYSVTQEKQMLLFRELFKYTLDPNHVLYWNSTGEHYEEWTFEELKALSVEIEEYVRPFVRKQQELEIEIMNSLSSTNILNMDLDSYKEVMI